MIANCQTRKPHLQSLAIEVWLACGWAITILLEPVVLAWVVGRLVVGLKNRRRFILDDQQLHVHVHASRSNTREIENACMFAIASARAHGLEQKGCDHI